MNTNDFSKCKVGDKLWHRVHKEVTVLTNTATSATISFLVDGGICYANKIQDSEDQVLFFSKPQIIAPPEPKRLPEIPVGTLLEVWGPKWNSLRILARFAEFDNGRVKCKHQVGDLLTWDHYELAPETIRIRELEAAIKEAVVLVDMAVASNYISNLPNAADILHGVIGGKAK